MGLPCISFVCVCVCAGNNSCCEVTEYLCGHNCTERKHKVNYAIITGSWSPQFEIIVFVSARIYDSSCVCVYLLEGWKVKRHYPGIAATILKVNGLIRMGCS